MHGKCDVLESSRNHSPSPSPWNNCLPQNQSLVQKRLETAGRSHLGQTIGLGLHSLGDCEVSTPSKRGGFHRRAGAVMVTRTGPRPKLC